MVDWLVGDAGDIALKSWKDRTAESHSVLHLDQQSDKNEHDECDALSHVDLHRQLDTDVHDRTLRVERAQPLG